MDVALFIGIMAAGLAFVVFVIVRELRGASPDDPTPPSHANPSTQASDARDRPAGPGAESQTPHTSQLQPGEGDPDRPA